MRAAGNSQDLGRSKERNIEADRPAETGEQPFLGLESSRATSLGSEDNFSDIHEAQMEVLGDTGKGKVSLTWALGVVVGSNVVGGSSFE